MRKLAKQSKIVLKISSDIYNETYVPYLQDERYLQIFFGGSSSGKTVFLTQRCIEDIISGQRNYLIIRKVANSLTSSVFNEICKTIIRYKLSNFFHINKQTLIITCKTNSKQIIFKGLDDQEKIKGVSPINGVITDIWGEEATEFDRESFFQLKKRLRGQSSVSKRLTLSFNPIYKTHWIYKEFFTSIHWKDSDKIYDGKDLLILKTTYNDNRKFLESDDIYNLENEKDPYFKEVYTYGNWGILGKAVFTNWKIMDLRLLVKKFDNIKNGLDFGFTAPTAFIRSHYDKEAETIYIFKEWSAKQAQDTATFKALYSICKREVITADSNDPKTRESLVAMGLNIIPAVKGKGSKNFGIKWLQGKKIIIDPTCQGMINEAYTYQWKLDKNGDVTEETIKKNDHFWSALRYSYESEFGERVYSWA